LRCFNVLIHQKIYAYQLPYSRWHSVKTQNLKSELIRIPNSEEAAFTAKMSRTTDNALQVRLIVSGSLRSPRPFLTTRLPSLSLPHPPSLSRPPSTWLSSNYLCGRCSTSAFQLQMSVVRAGIKSGWWKCAKVQGYT